MTGRIQEVAFNFTAANQFSEWIRHDYYQSPFCVSLGVYFDDAGLEATLEVQYALDDMSNGADRLVGISQAAETITVTDWGKPVLAGLNPVTPQAPGHGLSPGDWVELDGSQLGIDGEYAVVTVPSSSTYTLTSTVSQAKVGQSRARSARVLPHDTLTGLTARAASNYAYPCYASRLLCTAFTAAGYARLLCMQGGNLR